MAGGCGIFSQIGRSLPVPRQASDKFRRILIGICVAFDFAPLFPLQRP